MITSINLLATFNSEITLYPVVSFFTIVSSIILGDLATGIFHWSVDNYGSIKTPIFGSVCAAFQGECVIT